MKVTIHSISTRLRVGDTFEQDGVEYVVEFINECRARCIPLARKQVRYETVFGKKVEFETDYAAINISPNSEVEVLRRLGQNWRESLYGKAQGKKVVAVTPDRNQGRSAKTRARLALQAA